MPAATGLGEHERLGYSWFVGFAPVEHPKIAFAVLLGTSTTWPLRAHSVARQVLADYVAAEAIPRHGRLLARR